MHLRTLKGGFAKNVPKLSFIIAVFVGIKRWSMGESTAKEVRATTLARKPTSLSQFRRK
jgi:hypothetical protein